jgi:hypothetical protein
MGPGNGHAADEMLRRVAAQQQAEQQVAQAVQNTIQNPLSVTQLRVAGVALRPGPGAARTLMIARPNGERIDVELTPGTQQALIRGLAVQEADQAEAA